MLYVFSPYNILFVTFEALTVVSMKTEVFLVCYDVLTGKWLQMFRADPED
jgi:hypothetical protein